MAAVAFTPSAREQNLRKTLSTNIASILAMKVDDLVQFERLGRELCFEDLRPIFQKTILLFQALSNANLDFVAENKLQELSNLAGNITNEFNMFRGFPTNQIQNRAARMENMKEKYEQAYEQIAPILGASQYVIVDEAAVKMEQEAWNTRKAEIEKEMADTLTKAKDVAAKAGISKHEQYFKTESDEHKQSARGWLLATIVLAAVTAILAWVNYGKTLALLEQIASAKSVSPEANIGLPTGILVQLAVAKLIMFSILFSAVLWAGRIYRAHRHNYVVNKHRLNALSTFEAFAKAPTGDDAATKNAVLLQATQCIFNPQATGYLGSEKDTEGHSSVLEIFRSMPSSKV